MITDTGEIRRPLRIRAGVGRPHFGERFDRGIDQGTPAALPRGVFVFSLDFELGVAAWDDRALYHRLRARIVGTRAAIRALLSLLESYNISATWATVGHLFRQPGPLDVDVEDWVAREIPSEHLFAPDMIDALKACKTPQDIGCHTYRHVNAAAPELNDDIVDDELYECGRLARERGIDLRSFVFPFNRVGRLELLARHGYSSYRGANSEWYTRAPAGQHRVFRLARSLLKLTDDWLACTPPVDLPRRVPSGLWMIPHSMFYKGAAPGGRLFIGRLARKAERGMRRAAERRGVFHVWTHPQNLGVRTDKALAGLERIFRVADQHRRSGTLDILSMAQLAERLNQSQRSTVSPPC